MEEGIESERIPDNFICAVCLDVLYKPIVLVCGHVACFWCCQRSMHSGGESHCPLCRHPYHHFPAICQMLHFFLKKMYPISYERRKTQTLEYEKHSWLGFSLDIDALVTGEESHHQSTVDQPSDFCSQDNFSLNPSSAEEKNLNEGSSAGTCMQVSIADVLCAACKQLLFRPVVLNCGDVYCEACITVPVDGVIKCQVCQCRHPSGVPKVCRELDQFLEEQLSSKYAQRRSSTQLLQERIQNGNPSMVANNQGPKFSYPTEENFLQWWTVNGSKFHETVGCDMCGMFPIIGDRYHCKDCTEMSGYDLCGDCHNSGLNLPGRFNQKHTPEHRFELAKTTINRRVIFRLLRGQHAVVTAAATQAQSNPANVNPEFASPSLDDDDNDVVGVVSIEQVTGTIQDQRDNRAPM